LIAHQYRQDYLEQFGERKDLIAQLMLESFQMREKFVLRQQELGEADKLLFDYMELTKDDLIDYFDTDKGGRIYTFPYLEEKMAVTFFNRRVVPAKGFLWHIHTEKEEKPFGVVELIFYIDKVSRNDNDTRFEKVSTVFKEQKSYIYNYDEDVYEQVDVKAKNEKTEEYLERKKAAAFGFAVLGSYDREYISSLVKLGEYVAANKRSLVNSEKVFVFVERYLNFIELANKMLPAKVLFSHISFDEFQEISVFLESLQAKLNSLQADLDKLMKADGIDFVSLNDAEMGTIAKSHYLAFQKKLSGELDVLVPFVSGYEMKDKIVEKEAFFKITDATAVPTLYEVEKRRHFSFENEKKLKYEEEVKRLIAQRSKR
jgi:hypothetical protein